MKNRTYPETDTQTVLALDNFKEKSIDHTYRFGEDLKDFAEAIGITRLVPLADGMRVDLHGKPEVTLADGNVPEGEIIPLSKVTPGVVDTKKVTLRKHRKATTGEAIQTYGLDQAVDQTDADLIKEIQIEVRKQLFEMIQSGSEQTNLNVSNGLQGALATAWGSLQTIFNDDAVRVVVFAHPMDVAQAIADKQLSLETSFGLRYYTDATGVVVFTSASVARGSVYATATENLVIAYIPAGNSELGRAFGLTSDNTGFAGMTHFVENQSLTQQTLIVSGVLIYPERLDGVVKIPLSEAPVGK